MTDKDNIILEDFFKQAAQQQIEDNGFTERVMQNLPKTNTVRRLSRLWSLFCILVGAGLFFAFGGWQVLQGLFFGGLRMLLGWIEVFALTAPTTEININLWFVLLLVGFVLVVLPYQTYRKLSATL
jgi:membrane protein insertase Oxa1/YidC/SpoIIIJ